MLASFSVKKPFTVLVAVILILVLGVVSFTNMTPDLLPSIELPYVVVVTTYAGAAPEEVEMAVTKPLEQSMATLENIKSVSSSSSANVSMVVLEFTDTADMSVVGVDIREKIDLIKDYWPAEVSSPYVLKLNPDMLPVTVAAVGCEGMSRVELSAFVEETLLPALEGTEGVASISVSGSVEESVHIVLSEEKIAAANETVNAAIRKQFGSARSQINNGLTAANDALGKISAGKTQLQQAQAALPGQIESTRQQLQDSRQALESLKAAGPMLQQLYTAVQGLEAQRAARVDALRTENPAITEEAILADPAVQQLDGQLAAIDTQLAAYGLSLSTLGGTVAMLPTIDEDIAEIDAALAGLDGKAQQAQSQLIDQQVQLILGEKDLTATIGQLEGTLSSIRAQEKAAYASADLSRLLTYETITGILTAQNFAMPAGYADSGDTPYLIQVGDEIASVEELKSLVLFDMGIEDVEPITLGDVADVFAADNSAEVYARINGENGVLLSFNKQSGYATATVSKNILEKFEELSEKYPGVSFAPLMDQGDYIDLVVGSVLENLLVGGILAVVILWLFLRDMRPTFITACSIPISVTFALVLMYFSGVTLNIISLAGLAVGVGMLVDNSIVVIENIYRLRGLGLSPAKAAISGAAQVAAAVTASTLTTVCVFFPIVFVQGITRDLFTDMALTIGYSLLASLVIALTLVPAMARGTFKKEVTVKEDGRFAAFLTKYRALVEKALDHKALVLGGTAALLALSLVLAVSRGFIFMPAMQSPQVSVTLTMPEDSSLAVTADTADSFAEKVMAVEGVTTVGSMLESGSSALGGLTGGSDTSSVTMYVLLDEKADLDGIVREIKILADGHEGCDISVSDSSSMSLSALGGSGVSIALYGNDLDDLQAAARQTAQVLSTVEGVASTDDGLGDASPVLHISVDKNKAMENGLTVAQVYLAVSERLTETATATTLNYSGGSRSVIVSGAPEAGATTEELKEMEFTVTTPAGEEKTVALADIATFENRTTPASISRSAQRRTMTVSGTLAEGYNVSLVTADAEAAMADVQLPAGISYAFTGENETIMDSMVDLLLMMLLGVLIVYLIMVAQFQSLLSPFIVMFTIPLAFTGGLLALWLCGMEVSVVAMIGFVMLVGIIVNNGIVLIDYINLLRREGKSRREAILEAGATRLRPVLMTALTTVLGLMPMAIGMGLGAELMQPVAVVCIGGLAYATVMTLFVVPVMYDLLIKKEVYTVSDADLEISDL